MGIPWNNNRNNHNRGFGFFFNLKRGERGGGDGGARGLGCLLWIELNSKGLGGDDAIVPNWIMPKGVVFSNVYRFNGIEWDGGISRDK